MQSTTLQSYSNLSCLYPFSCPWQSAPRGFQCTAQHLKRQVVRSTTARASAIRDPYRLHRKPPSVPRHPVSRSNVDEVRSRWLPEQPTYLCPPELGAGPPHPNDEEWAARGLHVCYGRACLSYEQVDELLTLAGLYMSREDFQAATELLWIYLNDYNPSNPNGPPQARDAAQCAPTHIGNRSHSNHQRPDKASASGTHPTGGSRRQLVGFASADILWRVGDPSSRSGDVGVGMRAGMKHTGGKGTGSGEMIKEFEVRAAGESGEKGKRPDDGGGDGARCRSDLGCGDRAGVGVRTVHASLTRGGPRAQEGEVPALVPLLESNGPQQGELHGKVGGSSRRGSTPGEAVPGDRVAACPAEGVLRERDIATSALGRSAARGVCETVALSVPSGDRALTLQAKAADAGVATLWFLAVHPAMQRMGLGRALLERVVWRVRARGVLTVTVRSNSKAMAFYERLGLAREASALLAK